MAKRISSSSVNWGLLLEIVSPESRNALIAFKAQSEKYVRDIADLPTELPKIDWGYYKSKIAASGVVDSFQKAYETLKVPYPTDQGWIAKVEAEGQRKSKEFEKIYQEGLKEIAKHKDELKEFDKQIPFSQATLEEIFLMRPDIRIDPEKPKLWPQFWNPKTNQSSEPSH